MTLKLGSIPPAQVSASQAAGDHVRVFYSGTTASQMQSITAIAKNAPSITGTVASVSNSSLVIKEASGASVRFTIKPSDVTVMDPPHLQQHEQAGTKTIVYYSTAGGTKYAFYYEDAP
jgi:hypothetical protein